jgi:superfamily II DNA or RNA helicase
MVNKSDLRPDLLQTIRDELTVKPMIKSSFIKKAVEAYPVFQEGQTRLLLPKYYALEKLGKPAIIDCSINDADRINLTFRGKPRDYQLEIIDKCSEYLFEEHEKMRLKPYGGGVITIPPGKGKTFIALYLLFICKVKTLIVVHTEFLVGQWMERIKQYIPDARIGVIQGKKIDIDNKDIVIGMLQSISGKDYDDDIFEGFPLVIFDEVHHLGAKMFSKALLKIQAPYTIGLSATPKRKDRLDKVFLWHLGPMMYEMYAQIDSTILVKAYNFSISKPDNKYKLVLSFGKQPNTAKMITNLTEVSLRNKLIINMINDIFPVMPPTPSEQQLYNRYKLCDLVLYDDDNLFDKVVNKEFTMIPTEPCPYKYIINYRKLIILTDRREHLAQLEKELIAINLQWKERIGYYIGGMRQDELKLSEQKSIILATFQMASEALDIKGLDTVILCTPQSDVVQATGRIMREEVHKRKNIPTIYDIVDSIDIFRFQAKKRFMDYVDKEYQIIWHNVCDEQITEGHSPFAMVNLPKKKKAKNDDDDFID